MNLRKLIYAVVAVVLAIPIISVFKRTAFWGRKKVTEKELLKMFDCGDKSLESEALEFLSSI